MKKIILFATALMSMNAFGAKLEASGRAKAFTGPEGEIVTTVPLENNTKLLIFTENTYGPLTNKALIYDYDQFAKDATYPNPKRKKENDHSKVSVLRKVDNQWEYNDDLQDSKGHWELIKLTYSAELSRKIDAKKLIGKAKAYGDAQE